MATSIKCELEGVDAVNAALSRVQPNLRDATVPVIKQVAAEIAAGAKDRLRTDTPENLFRRTGGKVGRPAGNRKPRRRGIYQPTYKVQQKGPYWFRVTTGAGRAAKGQMLAEFMRNAKSGQGRALTGALDNLYGRSGGAGNGRVLWAVADELAPGAVQMVQQAVREAAGKIQSEMR